jgi:L-iditol 2-dehydrogenase
MHLYRLGRIGDIVMTKPLVIGHECVGTVDKAGPGVNEALVGKRVAIEPQLYCGKCRWCIGGTQNLCPYHTFLGLPPTDGAMQEFLVHPAHLVAPLPDGISDDAGVALEPMSVALHALRLAKVRPGQSIVIFGCGVMGTCVLMLLGLYRGINVACVDILPDRLERAASLGAKTILARPGAAKETWREAIAAAGGLGADIVFECAGADETLRGMCEVAMPGGHIIVIGTNPDDKVEFSSGSTRRRGLTIRFVRRSLNTLPGVLALAEKGLVDPGRIVTHSFGAHRTQDAYKLVDGYKDRVLKAVIDMRVWG